MVIIISLSFGERREDEKDGDYFGFVSTDSSLVCRTGASPVPQVEVPPCGAVSTWLQKEGEPELPECACHSPSREFPCNADDIAQEMKRQILTSYLKRSDNSLASLIQHCDLFLKPSWYI